MDNPRKKNRFNRLRSVALLALLVAAPSWGRLRVQGDCMKGGVAAVINSGLQSSNKLMGSYPQCLVTVYTTGTTSKPSLYSNNSGTSLANPFTAQTNGHWYFYVDNGRYDVTMSGGGFSAPYTLGDISVSDPASPGSVSSVSAGLGISVANGTGAAVITNTKPEIYTTDYNFAVQSPTGSITGGVNFTLTLTPVPLGVNWNDGASPFVTNGHKLWVAGTGTPEACYIVTAGPGTATSGATTGTLTLHCAGSHNAGFTVASASGGIYEAQVANSGVGTVVMPSGTITLRDTLVLPTTISLKGQGVGASVLSVPVSVVPGLVIASDPTISAQINVGRHSGYRLVGAGNGSGTGLWLGGDPNNVFAPSTYFADFISFSDVVMTEFNPVVRLHAGSFVSFNHSNLSTASNRTAFYIAPADPAGQPVGFVDCVVSSSSGAAISSSNQYADIHFVAGQIAGTVTSVSGGILLDTLGTHWENNDSDLPLIDINNVGSIGFNRITIIGGEMSFHVATTLAYGIRIKGDGAGSQPYLTIQNVLIGTNGAITDFVLFDNVYRGFLNMRGLSIGQSGSIGSLYRTIGTAPPTMDIQINNNATDIYVNSQAASSTITLPQDNYPIRTPMNIYGGTVGGGITTFSGHLKGQQGTFYTASPQTFVTGATIGNSITTVPGVPYTLYDDGTLIWISGPSLPEHYIATDTGASNAIIGSLPGTVLADGLCVEVQLAHSLQAGVNTFAYNGGSAVAIKSSRNPANNIATAYASTGRWRGCYSGGSSIWLDSSQ